MKETEAEVVKKGENYVVLDKTVFYPKGGGQPSDVGEIYKNGNAFRVVNVEKREGGVFHFIDGEFDLEVGDKVVCRIEWNRRYKLMRMHTAAHVLASVFFKDYNAKITGNQLDVESSRFDFNLPNFSRELVEKAIEKANSLIKEGKEVKVYWLKREEALKDKEVVKLAKAFPPSLDYLRIVEIVGVDKQADGGTHVKNTKEIGEIKLVKLKNKGKDNKRLYFSLSP